MNSICRAWDRWVHGLRFDLVVSPGINRLDAETVLRAMGVLRELPVHVIAAADDSPESFRETAKSLGISERCRFEPSREDVLGFCAVADLYVSPTREDSFGLPITEAMACGLPVITSMHAGVADR